MRFWLISTWNQLRGNARCLPSTNTCTGMSRTAATRVRIRGTQASGWGISSTSGWISPVLASWFSFRATNSMPCFT